jgi:bacillithiol system protein YtxJ
MMERRVCGTIDLDTMNWNKLRTHEQIMQIKAESKEVPVLIFKHSTRCNISQATLDRLERNWKEEDLPAMKLYFLDLLSYRQISDLIATEFNVWHESPQVLIIQNERSTFDTSHFNINFEKIKEVVTKN